MAFNLLAALSAAQSLAQSVAQKPGTKSGDLAHQITLSGLLMGAVKVAVIAGVVLPSWAPAAAGIAGVVIWHLLPDKQQQEVTEAEGAILQAALAVPTAEASFATGKNGQNDQNTPAQPVAIAPSNESINKS